MSSEKSFNDAHTSTIHEDTMCTVMPLRLGIFLIAVCTVIWCSSLLLFSGFAEDMIIFTGGYCLKSQIVLCFIKVTGIIFGICGALGAWYSRRSYVMTFNLWQIARILAMGFMYYTDVPILNTCEMWVNDVDSMIAKYGWNDYMYKIAMAAVCGKERTYFWMGSVFFFVMMLYVTWCTHQYLEAVGKVPKHLLRIPKDLSSGAWYTHSLGEKHQMNGQWGQARQMPMPQTGQYGAAPARGPAPFSGVPFAV